MTQFLKPRQQQKEDTRRALVNAACTLAADGRGLAGISLREITRQAGVVPTAFYRHFQSVDELGLVVVEEVGATLRQAMAEIHTMAARTDLAIQESVRHFLTFVQANREAFDFIARERVSGPPCVRAAITREVQSVVDGVAVSLLAVQPLAHLTPDDARLVADLLVNTVHNLASEILPLDDSDASACEAIEARTISQLRIIFVGARHWDSARAQRKRGGTAARPLSW